MKKLLFLLFPVFSYGQITINKILISGNFSTTGIASFGIGGSGGYVAGNLYILFVGTSNDAGTPAVVTISGTGQTWDDVTSPGGIINGGNRKRMQVFRYAPTSGNSNNTNFTYTGTQDGGWFELFVVTGCDVGGTNGSNAIVQYNMSSVNGADPTLTLTNPILNRGAVMFGAINGTNPFTGTPESGWGESTDNGYATPNTGGYVMYRTNTTDNTPTVTMASDNWAAIAFELRASGRRAVVIN